MTLVEEDVIFGLVAGIGGKVLTHDTMPVGTVLFIKLFLDVFGHEVLHLDVIDCVFSLYLFAMGTYFIASAIMSELSGMSTILSFDITSAIHFIDFL
jgi:hypothetical protein